MRKDLDDPKRPRLNIAERVLPKGLYQALKLIFSEPISGCMLVGGTALAGFYAGHRRSDDLDLFTSGPLVQKAVLAIVRSLRDHGAKFQDEFHTEKYYRTTCVFLNHKFTIDIVEDSNLFQVGKSIELSNGIHVADFETLLITKAATLVSRCSEKDLYDLLWILEHEENTDIVSGMNGESLLLSVSESNITEHACDFSLNPKTSAREIFKQIKDFKKTLIRDISSHLRNQPTPPLHETVKKIRKIML